MNPKKRLQIELLEDRNLLSFDSFWLDPTSLRLSFAPDGTSIGPYSSSLWSTLEAEAADRNWQYEILRAAQSWAIHANINIGLTTDDGSAFGSEGLAQGDSRFGDIRVGAFAQPHNTLAVAALGTVSAGTWAGDVFLNSSLDFGSDSPYDLYSLMLHEFGHVFGFHDNYDDPTSTMYGYYNGLRTGVTDGEIAALVERYGARVHDSFDTLQRNDSIDSATELDALGWVTADLTTMDDVDYYRIDVSESAGSTLRIDVRSSGLSLLLPRLRVFDSAGNQVAFAEASDLFQNDASLVLNVEEGASFYYLAVERASDDVFGIGGYSLGVNVSADAIDAILSQEPDVAASTTHEQANTDVVVSSVSLTVDHAQLYHLAGSVDMTTSAAIRVLDQNGNIVYSANGTGNGSVTANVFLTEGEYTIQLLSNAAQNSDIDIRQLLFPEFGGNTAPYPVDDEYTIPFKNQFVASESEGVLANDYDPEYDFLTVTVVQPPSHGTLVLNSNGSFTYTPDDGYVGQDTFVYKASDGQEFDTATVTLNIVNSAPFADDDFYFTSMATKLEVTALFGFLTNDFDSENNPLTAILVDSVEHGTLTFNSDGSFIYTPNQGFTGTDRFRYKAYDGNLYSGIVTVYLEVIE